MAEVLIVQHAEGEGAGTLGDALCTSSLAPRYVKPFAGESIPAAPGAARALVVLGGSMSALAMDRDPYLYDELRLIEAALKRGTPVLGICLGAQLVARVLGARVYRAPRIELGWLPVKLFADPLWAGAPETVTPFHWHEDAFDLPAGAARLAESDLCSNQAYRLGNAIGIQFHPEVDEGVLRSMAGDDVTLRSTLLQLDLMWKWIPIARRFFDAWVEQIS